MEHQIIDYMNASGINCKFTPNFTTIEFDSIDDFLGACIKFNINKHVRKAVKIFIPLGNSIIGIVQFKVDRVASDWDLTRKIMYRVDVNSQPKIFTDADKAHEYMEESTILAKAASM